MFYRLSGTYHTSYQADRKLWKTPTDRWLVIALLVLALLAPTLHPLSPRRPSRCTCHRGLRAWRRIARAALGPRRYC